MVWDKDYLGWWERAKRETLAGVVSNPKVAVFVRNPKRDRRSLRSYGAARIVDDPDIQRR